MVQLNKKTLPKTDQKKVFVSILAIRTLVLEEKTVNKSSINQRNRNRIKGKKEI